MVVKTTIIFLLVFSSLFPSAKDDYKEGLILLKAKRYNEAILKFKSSIKKNLYYKESYNKLGEIYYEIKDYKSSIKFLKKAIDLDPFYTDAIINLGLAYESDGQANNAISLWKKAIKNDPVNEEFHYNLANCFYKKGQILDAIKEYKKVVEIEPSYFMAYIKLGDIYKEKKEKDKAINFYEDAKTRNPKSPIPYISLGNFYYELGETDKAIWEYNKAISREPNSIDAINCLGRIYLEKKDYEKAEKFYKKLNALVQQDPFFKYSLGLVYELSGMHEDALLIYDDALTLDPSDSIIQFRKEGLVKNLEPVWSEKRKVLSSLHLSLGDQYFKERLILLAIYEYKRAIMFDPQDTKPRFRLARIYWDKKMLFEVEDELLKIIELDPENKEAKDLLERVGWENRQGLIFKEKKEEIPQSTTRLLFIDFSYDNPILFYPYTDEYLNHLTTSLLSYSEKIDVVYVSKKIKEDEAIKLARENGCSFYILPKVKKDLEKMIFDGLLVDMEDLRKKEITSQGTEIKDVVFNWTSQIIDTVPIKGNIFRIEEDNIFVNIGSILGIKDGDILEVFEGKKQKAKIKITKASPYISKGVVILPQTVKELDINQEVRLSRKK